jgi:hypothetical protein
MLYLFLLRQKGNPAVIQMKNILDTYHRLRGSEVKMLGGQELMYCHKIQTRTLLRLV